MPGVRVYCENDTRFAPVANVTSTNKVQILLTVADVDHGSANVTQKSNMIWKVRPWIDLSVDEF